MTSSTKASSAGSTSGGGAGLGSIRRGALAGRASLPGADATAAPSHRLTRLAVTLALATTFALVLATVPAQAKVSHAFSTSFGTSGSGDGQLSLVSSSGLAVNTTSHDVYVADTANARIDQFSSAGTFIRAFGADVGGAGVNVCTTGCVAGTPGSGPGAFTTPTFIAVDNSGGSSQGDVYVADTTNNVVSKFDASGALITTWGSGGQLDGSTATTPIAGPFGSLAGITVDTSGNLGVFDTNTDLFTFAEDGTFTSDSATARGTAPNGLAVDPAGHFFKVNGDGSVEEFLGDGTDVGTVTPDGAVVPVANGIAIDPASGDLYTDQGSSIAHYAFDGSGSVIQQDSSTCPVAQGGLGCNPTDSFGSGDLSGAAGLAVNPATGDVYVADTGNARVVVFGPIVLPDVTTGAASNIGPTSATLNGTVNPAGLAVTDCHFDYVDDAHYDAAASDPYSAGATAPCAETVGSGTSDVPVHADISGLTVGTTYHFRLQASNANGPNAGQDATFATPPPPSIDAAFASNLTLTDADLTAEINPNGFDTTYHFDWGTDTSYGNTAPIPDGDIGDGSIDVAVSTHLTGLTPDTTYHWRIVAQNANGTVGATVDHTFIYPTTGGALPDNRAYEMVTPPQKNGTLIGDAFFGAPPEVAGSGSRVVARVIQCFADAESCVASRRGGTGSPYSFSRTSSGWVAKALAPPASLTSLPTIMGYNADTGTALFSGPTQPVGEDDLYGRQADGSLVHIGPVSDPGLGPQGAVGGSADNAGQAFSADLSHVAFGLAPQATPWQFDPASTSPSAYEYVGAENSQPFLVGVSGGQGSTDLIGTCGTELGDRLSLQGVGPGMMSADGRTVYFNVRPCASGSGANAGTPVPADTLYARIDGELPTAHTVPISQRSPADCTTPLCLSSSPSDANFQGISTDGSKAFFTSTQQLTDSASQDPVSGDSARPSNPGCVASTGPNGCNLYLFDFSRPAGRELTAVSAGDTSGGGPRMQGVMAISSDGSHAYFVARGVLTSSPNAQGQSATAGADNLYVYDAATGDTSFVAALPASDSVEWTGTPNSNVTSSGRFLVFTSHRALTSDTGPSGVLQVFRYDAQTGDLVRISVGEGGFNDNGNGSGQTHCNPGSFACSEDASIVLPPLAIASRTDPTMSDDGAYVFFKSPVGLTPRALDDVQIDTDDTGNPVYAQNVYEWHAGHVHLISDGRDTGRISGDSDVSLLGTDATGQNVFFSTSNQLAPQDTDTEFDYYDARVGGGFPFTPPPEPCNGDNCKPPPSGTPIDPSAGSSAVNGPGNQGKNLGGSATSPTKKKCKKGKRGRKCRKHNRAGNTTRRAGK